MKLGLQIKPQEEIEKLSKEDLKSYIDNLQKELQKQKTIDDTAKSLVENFVLSKYIFFASAQNITIDELKKQIRQRESENPEKGKIILTGTMKQGKLIPFGFIDEVQKEINSAQTKILDNLDIDHNKYIFNTLKTKYPNLAIEYINGTILPPQKLSPNLASKGNSKTQEKPQNLDKIGKLMKILDILSNQNGLIINHIYITREHDKNIMRQTDYIAIYITVKGLSKTILINDEYGEGSFIIENHLDQESLITLDKSSYTGFELKYDKNELDWLGKFRDKILEKTDDLKTDELSLLSKEKLAQEKYILHYKSIFDGEKYGGLLSLVKYSKPEIQKLKIDEKGVCAIATDIGFQISNKSNLPNPIGFRKLLCYLYNVSDEELIKLLKLELINIFDSKDFGGIHKLAKYSTDQIRDIYINGLYIMKYASILGFKMTGLNPLQFKLFLGYLYNIGQSDINLIFKNKLLEIFNSDEFGGIHKLAFYTKRDIKAIKINNQSIGSLASETGFIVDRDSNNVEHSGGFRKFILYLYDITEEDLQKIIKIDHNKQRLNKKQLTKIHAIIKLYNDKKTKFSFEFTGNLKSYNSENIIFDKIIEGENRYRGFTKKYGNIYNDLPKGFSGFTIFFKNGIISKEYLRKGSMIKTIIEKYISNNKYAKAGEEKLLDDADIKEMQRELNKMKKLKMTNGVVKLYNDKEAKFSFEYVSKSKVYKFENISFDEVIESEDRYRGFTKKYGNVYNDIYKSFYGFTTFFMKGIISENDLGRGSMIKAIIEKYISKNKDVKPGEEKLLDLIDRQEIQQQDNLQN